ncbi:hypothetical protein GWI33_016790 [Rhynchophorus ferrugineus]|uniref:Uncharacterized protein n=1 Tax=Rhynchophorus ferrugineus TaxID=354439 RepID=A0A834HWR4_RHYFE|nr:hypothetical protein GWI33_016790 [Rhynchophorus ferrugineus]
MILVLLFYVMSNSDEDASTKQVLNYYKNYSQSPHLQKYFSGAETVSFTILDTKEEKTCIPCNVPKIIITESSSKEQCVKNEDISPCYMQRSNSLPTKLCETEVQLDLSQVSSTDNVKVLVFDSSTSSSHSDNKPEETQPIASSSSNSLTKTKSISSSSSEDKKIFSFGLTLSQLKEKIGVPIAFSTPTFALGEVFLANSDSEATPISCSPKSVNKQDNYENYVTDETCVQSTQENVFSQVPDSIYRNKKIKSKRKDIKDRKSKAVKMSANVNVIDSTPKVCVKPEKSTRRLVLSSVEEEDIVEKTRKLNNNILGNDNAQNALKPPDKKTIELSQCEPVNVDCLCADKVEIAVQTDPNRSLLISNSVEGSSCDSFEYISSNGRHNESTISSSDKDGDFDKLIDVLQILLVTNRKKTNSKKQQVKKIIKKLLSTSESDPQMSSSSSPENKRSTRSLDAEKHSRRSDSFRQSSKNTTRNSGDYLLKFAENERLYQIAWIDNEIGHLSKLKKFLETNKGEQKGVKTVEKKQSRYKVVGADQGTNEAPQREYVIETDMAVPIDANINYVIDGKQFIVDPPEVPIQNGHSPVFADIAVESKPSSTNIKISTLCSKCKQPTCVCEVTSDQRKAEDSPALYQDIPHVADMNSLEKAFHNCDCKTEHSDDTCPLVQKLAKHFTRCNAEKLTSNAYVQAIAPKLVEGVTKETQVMWEKQNNEGDGVYVAETEHTRKIISPVSMPSSEKTPPLYREKETASLRIQTENNRPEKITKEVQARVETLDRQVQYLKTLLKGRDNGVNDESSGKTHDDTEQVKVGKPQCPKSDSMDKMIQTETKACSCGTEQTEMQGGLDGESEQVKKEVFSENRSTSDQIIQTENGTNVSGNAGLPSATSATYSQIGSTSLSIPTSILDGQGSTAEACACCGRTFLREEPSDGSSKPNVVMCCCKKYALAYCTNPLMKCYCNGRSCKRTNYYCICDKNQSHKYKTYCKRCKKKLLDTMKQQKQSMAYTLILEENSNQIADNEKGNKPRKYDEVKIQIPKKQSSKKSKDRRNSYERNKLDSQRKWETEKETVQNSGDATVDNLRPYTLQEYLIENKPEFIYTAEYRRQLMLNSRIWRERNKDALKMHFLENRAPSKDGKFKLYSEQQMKEITRRNYEKLPEVRQKHVNKHKKCLKEADRVICERFAKKIQRNVLKVIEKVEGHDMSN